MGDRRYGTRSYDFTAGQKVSYTGTDGDTTAFDVDTEVVICTTTDCLIKVAVAPTASAAATSMLIPAKIPFHLQVPAGQKISFVQLSAGGDAYVVPTT